MDTKKSNALLPSLSVLIGSYNYARFIGEAIESVLNQSYRPMEVIVIDNASTDNSVEIIQRFIDQNPIVHLIMNEKNFGGIYVFNQFLSLAKGEYIYIVGADDRLLPGFLEKSMKLLARYPEAGVCSTLAYKMDEKGKNKGFFVLPIVSKKECFIPPKKAISIVNKVDNYIPGHTAIYKRKVFNAIGGLIPELHAVADAFALKVIVCKYGACFIPEALVCIRTFPNSYSKKISKDLNCNKEIWRVMEPLLTETYKEYFTPKHVNNISVLFSHIINSLALSDLQNKEIDYIKEHIPPKRILERILFLLITVGLKSQRILYKLYVFTHLRRKIWPVIYNKLFRSLHFHILYFISKMRRTVV